MIDVSTVIPCFNAAATLRDTIDSVLAQRSEVSLEIIAVNDGSTDATAACLASFGDAIRCHETVNRGASAARELGRSMAVGKNIVFLDADDVLVPGTLRARVDAAAANGVDVVYTDWEEFRADSRGVKHPGRLFKRRIEDVNADPQVALFTDFWAPPGAYLFSRQLLDRMPPWSDTLPVIQDARFVLEAAMARGRFQHVPQIGVRYRVVNGGSSLSKKSPLAFLQDCLTNAAEVEALWKGRGQFTAERHAALIGVYAYVGADLLRMGAYASFHEAHDRLMALGPGFRWSRAHLAGWLSRGVGAPRARILIRGLDRLMNVAGRVKRSGWPSNGN